MSLNGLQGFSDALDLWSKTESMDGTATPHTGKGALLPWIVPQRTTLNGTSVPNRGLAETEVLQQQWEKPLGQFDLRA